MPCDPVWVFFWGGECRFYFYGRGDFSDNPPVETPEPLRAVALGPWVGREKGRKECFGKRWPQNGVPSIGRNHQKGALTTHTPAKLCWMHLFTYS